MGNLFFIQGVFFQEREYLSIGFDEKIGERVAINNSMFQTMFSGVLGKPYTDAEYMEGNLLDAYGKSDLCNVQITETELSFMKRYVHRTDEIMYKFTKDSETNSWIGTYKGNAIGEGIARCIITPAEIFYDVRNLMEKLEK